MVVRHKRDIYPVRLQEMKNCHGPYELGGLGISAEELLGTDGEHEVVCHGCSGNILGVVFLLWV